MPPLNSLWVFTEDWPLPSGMVTRYGNEELFKTNLGQAQLNEMGPVIPAGTVVSFNRYHASNSGDVQMTLQFYRSPNPYMTPKKRGGKGKGPMRFYLNLEEFNSLGEMLPFDPEE